MSCSFLLSGFGQTDLRVGKTGTRLRLRHCRPLGRADVVSRDADSHAVSLSRLERSLVRCVPFQESLHPVRIAAATTVATVPSSVPWSHLTAFTITPEPSGSSVAADADELQATARADSDACVFLGAATAVSPPQRL